MRRIPMFGLVTALAVSSMALGQEAGKKDGNVEEELKTLDHNVLDAEKKFDIAALEQLFAPSYFLVLPNGEIYSRGKWIGILKGPDHPTIEVLDSKDIHVHVFGNMAILTDTTTLKSHDNKGVEFSGTFRVFRVCLKQQGKWRLAGVEMTPLKSQ